MVQQTLKIRKASAGSGKTFLLVQNYITLLLKLKKEGRFFPHRTILAVTFTNKATKEMKTRILKELFILSDSQKKSEHRDPLCQKLGYNPDDLAKISEQVLFEILNDYSSFHISTIDKFFLKILRSFTREINLQSDYSIELDTTKVLNEAVKNMLLSLENAENNDLFEWLLSFSQEKIDNGKSWDIEKDILRLAKNLFREDVKVLDIPNQQKHYSLKDYQKNLNGIARNFEEKTKKIAEEAEKVLEKHNLSINDFSSKKKSFFNQFYKAKKKDYECKKTFVEAIDNVDKWYAKNSNRKEDIKASYEELNPLMNKLYELIKEDSDDLINYNSAKQILSKIYELGIIADVTKEIKRYLDEEGALLLADMNEFLSQIIENSNTPFIYEKMGTSIEHFMLDEFQDTSALQWKNFKPLIQESLDSGRENLIVGDVKQSIYRWRNSDWDLLNSKIIEDFKPEFIDDDSSELGTNWRSFENIVTFNNEFFKFASESAKKIFNDKSEICEKYSNKIETAYKVLEQKVGKKNGFEKGGVELTFVESKKDKKFVDSALNLLVQRIEELQDRGFSLSDITILVRTRNEIRSIAEFLSQYKKKEKYRYDIVSEEALLVAKSEAVQFLILAMKYFAFPNEKSCRFFFLFSYFTFVEGIEPNEAITRALSEEKIDFENNFSIQNKGSLYEQVELLIKTFRLSEKTNELIYIQTFQDIVFDFIKKNNADLIRFLDYWEEKKDSFFLPASEDAQDAISIITIHASKGLEFNVVLLPFCNWSLGPKNSGQNEHLVWLNMENKKEPFNAYPIAPIVYKKELEKTIFKEQYYEEMMQCYVDTLNVTYVAFTRAIKELYIFIETPSDKNNSTIPSLLDEFTKNSKEWIKIEEEYTTYRKGDFKHLSESEGKSDKEKNKLDKIDLIYPVNDIDWHGSLKKIWKLSSSSPIKMSIDYGILMHEVLSKVETIDNLQSVVDSYVSEGKITEEEKEKLLLKIDTFVRNHKIEDWFSGKYKVLNEVDILSGSIYRPDRIMLLDNKAIVVDYKFGKEELSKYKKQVENYCKLLKEMSYEAKGYLCYVELNKIIDVS